MVDKRQAIPAQGRLPFRFFDGDVLQEHAHERFALLRLRHVEQLAHTCQATHQLFDDLIRSSRSRPSLGRLQLTFTTLLLPLEFNERLADAAEVLDARREHANEAADLLSRLRQPRFERGDDVLRRRLGRELLVELRPEAVTIEHVLEARADASEHGVIEVADGNPKAAAH